MRIGSDTSSIYALKNGIPAFELSGSGFDGLVYDGSAKGFSRVPETITIYHLDGSGRRDALVDGYTGLAYAEENGIKLTDDDNKTIDDQIAKAKANYDSDEAYLNDIKSAYLTEDLYRKMLETATIYTKVNDTLFKNNGKYATKKEDFKKIVKDTNEYCREIHVMIPFYAQVDLDDSTADSYDSMSLSDKASAKQSAYAKLDDDGVKKAKEKAKKLAEEVLKKAQDGEDFDKLIEKYGWDLGLEDPSTGYYFNKDTTGYPEELVKDAFKLKENGISTELTENDTYGYFIIKRLPVDMDYVEQNIDDMIYSYDTPAISKLYNEKMDKMEVKYCDQWDKITADSIT